MTHSKSNKSFRTISLVLCLIALLLAASFGFNQRVVAMISPAVAEIVAPYKIAPAAQQVVLYIASEDGRLYAISIDTHDVVWSYQGGASANGVVYIGNQDEYLHAINSSTGELLWKFQADARISEVSSRCPDNSFGGYRQSRHLFCY
ncbi:MAG TPA: hypothetical protein VLR90_16945 [Blastocatellia bacterium]|nr:hypothetical protein [Blastocatellia bacterium]